MEGSPRSSTLSGHIRRREASCQPKSCPPNLSSARLFNYNPRRRAAIGAFAGDLFPDAGGHLAEDKRVGVVGLGDRDRGAAVGGFADLEVERHLAQELGTEALGFLAGAAVREDLAATAAMR